MHPENPDKIVKSIPLSDLLDLLRDVKDRTTRAAYDHLRALAADIGLYGVRTPLKVKAEAAKYRIVCGQTRKDAAVMAGLSEVPCEVLPPGMTETDLTILELTDNNSTDSFDELALGCLAAEVMQKNGWTPKEFCRHAPALDKATVSRAVASYTKATPAVQAAFRAGDLPARSMYQLSRLPADRQDAELPACLELDVKGVADHVNAALGSRPKSKGRPVKGRTPKGLAYALPPGCDLATAKAELAALLDALTKAEKQGLPLSTVPQLVRS